MSVIAVALASVALLGLSSIGGGAVAASAGPIHVRFLFDLGDGTYYWFDATIPDPTATNATWDALQLAASLAGFSIASSWYPGSGSFGPGIFITDVGDRSPPTVGLFVWDAANATWDAAPVGVFNLVLGEGAVVALADTNYNPRTYAPYPPAPTPDHPYPAPEFRGDIANTGSTPSTAPVAEQLLWDRSVVPREIESTPVVVGGRVYILTMDGMFALNEATGSVVWSNLRISGLSTPAFYNGSLLVDGSDGRVHLVSAATGAEVWNVSLVANPSFSGITSSPKLLFDTAYLGTFNESGGPGEVVAIGAVNGTILWRHTAPASVSFSSPAVAEDTVYVGIIGLYNTTTQVTYDHPYGVLALNATSGAERWFFISAAPMAASPVYAAGWVFAPAKDGSLYALDARTGSVRWRTAVQAGVSSPAYHDGILYVAGGVSSFGGPGKVTALNATTGATVWSFTPNGVVQSSVTYAAGSVVFATNAANGTIYVLEAKSGGLDWTYTPSPAQYIFGSPVVADGMVFAVSDNGHVYAFASAGPAPLGPSIWTFVLIPVIVLVAVLGIAAYLVWGRRRHRAP